MIILFHELGHFLLAKANGIKVNEFFLGFGPTLVKHQFGETLYSIKLLPLGGACVMEGEDEDSKDARAFGSKSVWARISVVFAGPFFNFIMAAIFAFIIIMSIGYTPARVDDVMEGYPAEAAGMQAGDEIVKLGNYSVHFYNEISLYSMFHQGEAIEVTYSRNGEKIRTTLTPQFDEESGRYLYGFLSTRAYERAGVGKAMVLSVYEVRYWIYNTVQSLKGIISGMFSVNDMTGPVGIVQSVGETYEQSAQEDGLFYAFLNMLNWGILLCANLGVMNLLPIPALDGGRLIFLIIEAIRGKRIDPEKEGMVHFIGICLLFALMFLIMGNDIRRIIFK